MSEESRGLRFGIRGRMARAFLIMTIGGSLIFGAAAFVFMRNIIDKLSSTELNEIVRGIHNMATLAYEVNLERATTGLKTLSRAFPGDARVDERAAWNVAAKDQVSGAASTVLLPAFTKGGSDFRRFEDVLDSNAAASGCALTVFQLFPGGMIRTMTSLRNEDGSRAVGTYIPASSPVYKAISAGKEFSGRANVLGKPYIALYSPLRDANGAVVGAFFSGIPQSELESLKKMVLDIKIGGSGYPYVIDSSGTLFIHPNRAGENLYDEKDAKGRYFIREICEKKEGTIVYPWTVPGKNTVEDKVVAYRYIPEMDWIVAAGTYLSDYDKPLKLLVTLLVSMITLLAGLSAFSAFLLSTRITKAIRGYSDALLADSFSLEDAAVSMSSSSQELASGAEELASTVEEVSSTMESLKDSLDSASRSMGEAEGTMVDAGEEAKASGERMIDLLRQLDDIQARSKEVSKIIKVIDDIAFQTNILALNAAVEAARAGDSGKGFAVVAEQVKALAQKSVDAATSTTEIITRSLESAERGKELCAGVAESLGAETGMTGKAGVLIAETSKAALEQARSSREVSRSMAQVNSIVQGTATSSEEMAATGEQLQAQAEQMRKIVMGLGVVVNGRAGERKIKDALEFLKAKIARAPVRAESAV